MMNRPRLARTLTAVAQDKALLSLHAVEKITGAGCLSNRESAVEQQKRAGRQPAD
jgi:hypothetical protein